jgi:hypothetical protein
MSIEMNKGLGALRLVRTGPPLAPIRGVQTETADNPGRTLNVSQGASPSCSCPAGVGAQTAPT